MDPSSSHLWNTFRKFKIDRSGHEKVTVGGIVQTPTFESLQKKTQNKTNNTKNVQDSPQLGVLSNYLWELHCPFYAEIRSNSLIQSTTLQFYHFFMMDVKRVLGMQN